MMPLMLLPWPSVFQSMIKRIKKFYTHLSHKLFLTKREKFGLIVGVLTGGLLLIQVLGPNFRYHLIIGLAVLTYVLFVWGLWEDLNGIEWLTLFILPITYVIAMPLFYFLLPVRWLTRLPIDIIFAVGIYAILLIENIYNVAAERTIQLLRAAHSVGLFLTLFTLFLLLNIIFSLHLPFAENFILIFIIYSLLSLQCLWAMKLEPKISWQLFIYCLIISLIGGELAIIFSFWPIQTIIESLFLTTIFYSLVGMIQQYLVERLFHRTVTEFISVSVVVFILVLITTIWG
ncbi:MAG: hypothetical protein V1858_02445 [Candidatus Gottesmanbacteria bacterium]